MHAHHVMMHVHATRLGVDDWCERHPVLVAQSAQAPNERALAQPRTRRKAVAGARALLLLLLGAGPHRVVRREAGEVRPSRAAPAAATGVPVAEGGAEVRRRRGAAEDAAVLRGVAVGLPCSTAVAGSQLQVGWYGHGTERNN